MKIKLTDISSVGATEGQVPRVNSSGGIDWSEAASGGGSGDGSAISFAFGDNSLVGSIPAGSFASSSSSYAGKGNLLKPSKDIEISALYPYMVAASGSTHVGYILELDSTFKITAILGTTNALSLPDASVSARVLDFTSPIKLKANTLYAAMLFIISGSTTTSQGSYTVSLTNGNNYPELGDTYITSYVRIAATSPIVGSTLETGVGGYALGVFGKFTPTDFTSDLSLANNSGKVLAVNKDGDGVEWVEGLSSSNPMYPVNVPTSDMFPFVANGGTVTTELINGEYGLAFNRTDSGTGSDVAGFVGKNVPSGTSWEAVIGFRTTPFNNGYIRQGIAIHESATGKTELLTFNTQNNDPRISGLYMTNLTTYNSGWFDSVKLASGPQILYFKVSYSADGYVFSYSYDFMASWYIAGTRTGFTADKIGLIAENYGSGGNGNRMLVHYYADPDLPEVPVEVQNAFPRLVDNAGKVLSVKSDETGVEWVEQTGGSGGTNETQVLETTDSISGFFGIYGSAGADDTTAYSTKGTTVEVLQDIDIDAIYGFVTLSSGQTVRGFVAEINTTTGAIVGTAYYTETLAYNAANAYYGKLPNSVRFTTGKTIVVGFIRMDGTGTTALSFPGSNTAKMMAPVRMLSYQYRWNTTSLTDGQVASSNNSNGTYPITIVGRAVTTFTYAGVTEADIVAEPLRISAPYWRVYAPADVTSSDSWIGIGELKWLDESGVNLTGTGTAFASGNYDSGWLPSEAFDNAVGSNNGWISTNGQKAYQWLGYNFGTDVTPYSISIAPISSYAGTLPSKLNIEFSFNGATWYTTNQATFNSNPGDGVYQDSVVSEYTNSTTLGLTVKNYQSRIYKTTPSYVQKATLRNDGVLALANTPKVGNTLVLVTAGFSGSMTSYIPSGFSMSGQYYSNSNNMVAAYTKTVTSSDTGSFTMSASDNQQAIIYEYKDVVGVIPVGGGDIPNSSGTGTFNVPANPYSLNGDILLAVEHDTSVQINFGDNLKLTKDYYATDSSNHKGAFGRYRGESSAVSVLASAFSYPVWGAFAVVGKLVSYNANQVVSLPEGGNTGQVLTKNTSNTNDFSWITPLQDALVDGKPYVRKNGAWVAYTPTENMIIAVGDETTPITVGASKVTFRMPYAFNLTSVRASLTAASNTGDVVVDINEAGATILSTKLSLDATEKTSMTAAVPVVISDANLADDAEITIDIDSSGSGAIGLKVVLIGTRVL